jgi:cytochrome c553
MVRPLRIASALGVSLGALLVTGAFAASQPRQTPDTMAERVLPCASCHGSEGRATAEGYFPRIAGKPAGYLYNQLRNFRDGRRNYPLMVYLVEYLTDDYLQAMAEHFAALEIPHPPPQPSKLSAASTTRAEALVRRGDAARAIPACADCHGDNLLGAHPSVPGLLGLSRFYLYAQLNHWKNGTRRAQTPDCMATIASRLTPEDVGALAGWLAAQPVPAGARPAGAVRRPLPLACGGVSE